MKLAPRTTIALAAAALALAGCSAINPGGAGSVGAGAKPVGWIYSTLYNQNAVLEIDKVQSRVQKEPIIVGNGPRSLAIDPRGRGEFLYVVCELGNTVDIVDRRNRRVNRSISVGRRPYGIAVTPGGERAFVTNSEEDTVSVIDMKTQSVLQTLSLNVQQGNQPGQPAAAALKPQGVAVNASGTRAYVACAGGQVVVLEGQPNARYTASRTVLLSGSVSPLNVAVSPGQEENVYVTDPRGNRLFFFSGVQAAQTAEARDISGSPWGVAVGVNPRTGEPDRLYVTAQDANALWPLSLPGLSVATQTGQGVSVEGRNPGAVAVSPIGNEVYVANSGSNNVVIFDRVGEELARPQAFNINQLNPQFISPTGDLALGGFLSQ